MSPTRRDTHGIRSMNKDRRWSHYREIEPKIHPWFETHWCPVDATFRLDESPDENVARFRVVKSLLSRENVNESCYAETGETRLLCTVGGVIEVPLVEVHLESICMTRVYICWVWSMHYQIHIVLWYNR
jgi:hypothetical protein